MKRFVCILLVFVMLFATLSATPVVFATVGTTYYIDSFSGDDSNDGTSQNSAWKTVENIEGLTLEAGDKILFKCDGVYECTLLLTCEGTKENPIVISSYSEGAKPLLTTLERNAVLKLFDCSYVTISGLEMTAHNGGGIWIDSLTKDSYGVTIENCILHDMQNYRVTTRDVYNQGPISGRAGIVVRRYGAKNFSVNDFSVIGCEIYDTGNGIFLCGVDFSNKNSLVKDCYLHDMDGEGIVVTGCDGALITNCRIIDTCQGTGVDEEGNYLYFIAAAWFQRSQNCIFEHCEIAGQKNIPDGMTVDFDGWTSNCTYQYIYSHDNTRFMCNCGTDENQVGNTVRYCLSVNDGNGKNRVASSTGEHDLKIYNNTIIGCGQFEVNRMYDSLFANNIIIPSDGNNIYYDYDTIKESNSVFTNNCYYNCFSPMFDLKSFNTKPGFIGGDTIEAYKLVKGSPLIGAGCEVEGNDLTEDFFGNEITSNNIGCYGGNGEDGEYVKETLPEKAVRNVRQMVQYLIVEAKKLIGELFEIIKENINQS